MGHCKSWTLDCGLDYGLRYGLHFGLLYGENESVLSQLNYYISCLGPLMEAWETRKHFENGVECLTAMVFILLVYYSAVLVYAFVIDHRAL